MPAWIMLVCVCCQLWYDATIEFMKRARLSGILNTRARVCISVYVCVSLHTLCIALFAQRQPKQITPVCLRIPNRWRQHTDTDTRSLVRKLVTNNARAHTIVHSSSSGGAAANDVMCLLSCCRESRPISASIARPGTTRTPRRHQFMTPRKEKSYTQHHSPWAASESSATDRSRSSSTWTSSCRRWTRDRCAACPNFAWPRPAGRRRPAASSGASRSAACAGWQWTGRWQRRCCRGPAGEHTKHM